MANINLLKSSEDLATLTAEMHYTVPSGNNAALVSWTNALVNSGYPNSSIMPTGTGPGQINSSDVAALAAGTLRTFTYTFQIAGFNGMTNQQKVTALNTLYTSACAADQAVWQSVLNFFGYSQ